MKNIIKSLLIISVTIFTLQACSIKDDFGRTKQSQLRENAVEVVGSIQEHTGLLSREAAFHIPYSGDELTLRMTLKHFRLPFLAKPILRDPVRTQGFTKKTTGVNFRSKIMNHIKSDMRRIKYFSSAVQAVITQDKQRYEVISHNYDVKDNDSRYIRVRIRENRAVTMRVMQLLDKRIASYDKAIEYAGMQYPRKTFDSIIPMMDLLRTKNSLLKSKFERYVYRQANYDETSNHMQYQSAK